MENKNSPINAVLLRQIGKDEFRVASEKDSREGLYLKSCLGLTKREYFAGLCLQGILAHSNISFGQDCDKRHLTSLAIKYADELLNQLENDTNI